MSLFSSIHVVIRPVLSKSSLVTELKYKKFPFGQLPVMILNNKQFGHTHSLAVFCAKKASLYEKDDVKILTINQVIDWANDITNKIAPSIRAAMRDKEFEKSKKLRKLFILLLMI